VRDDGMGMEEPMLAEVFEPFVQSERGLSRSEGGMGLGLTLVKALVELHGGSVSASSAGVDRGSEFVVRIPAAPTPAQAATPSDSEPADGVRHHILIVEDSDDHRETLRELLELSGYDVITAADGDRGIAAIKSERPDVALVDIGLPGIDGYELARQVRVLVGDTLRLVALTGYGSERDRKAALEAGFDEHLVKPVDFDEVQAVLSRLCTCG
jgi:two-component system, sensor histidine kinase